MISGRTCDQPDVVDATLDLTIHLQPWSERRLTRWQLKASEESDTVLGIEDCLERFTGDEYR